MRQILPDDEIAKDIISLKLRKVFNVGHKWAKAYVKYNRHNVEAVNIFLSGSGWTGKSHLVKEIYNTIWKTLLNHCKVLDKPRVTLLGRIWISAVNIYGITIFSGLGIKPRKNLRGINDKSEVVLWKLGKIINNSWSFCGIKWFMDRYWLNVERNIYDDSQKIIWRFFSYDCGWLTSITASQRKTYIFFNFLIKMLWII